SFGGAANTCLTVALCGCWVGLTPSLPGCFTLPASVGPLSPRELLQAFAFGALRSMNALNLGGSVVESVTEVRVNQRRLLTQTRSAQTQIRIENFESRRRCF